MQIPLSFLFGYFTDFGLWLVGRIPNDLYLVQLALLVGVTVKLFRPLLQKPFDKVLKKG